MPEIERDGVRLYYEERGDASQPPVVLLHGFTSDLRMWEPVTRRIEDDYHVIAMDMRGHGLSGSPAGVEHYGIEEYARDVSALLDALGIELCAVVGCSFGGMVALEFAVEQPGRVAALVVSDASPAPERPEYDERFRQREAQIAGMVDYVSRYGTAMLGRKLAQQLDDPFAARALRQSYERLNAEGFLGGAHARRTRRDVTGLMGARLGMPVMLVAGMDDAVYCAMAVMAEQLPTARQVIFRDTGHGVPLIHPRDFADALRQFFADIQEGAQIARQITV